MPLSPTTRRSDDVAWLITAPLLVVAAILFAPTLDRTQPLLSSLPDTVLFLGLFLLAEATALNVEVRRHSLVISLGEIPLVLALFYLSPLTLLLVRLVPAVAIWALRRATPVRLTFNVANIMAGNAAAVLVVYAFGPLIDTAPKSWLIIYLAVGASVLLTVAAVIGVIALIQGGMSARRIMRTATPSLVVGGINTTIGLVLLLAVRRSPWATLLIAGIAAAVVLVYRTYAQFLRQHKSLTEIYELTRAITEARNDSTLADVLLGRVRELLQAESATLWLPVQGRYPDTLRSARVL